MVKANQNADTETIEKVFRLLAKRYHPDHPISGNMEKINMILDAYHVLVGP